MKVLKLKLYQPEAHYRIPFSYKRRFTYPIPLYSTVKGLICNVLGINDNKEFERLKDGLALSIYGKYESIVKEYFWFRTLEESAHIKRFYTRANRTIDGIVQHPGGQMPVKVDVLHNVELTIYIYHDEDILNKIHSSFEKPEDWNSILHLGRAEDWLVINENRLIELSIGECRRINYITWIPEPEYVDNNCSIDRYMEFFTEIPGNLIRIPTFYEIKENNQRVFTTYIQAKLFEGGGFTKQEFYVDSEEGLPVILARLNGGRNE